MEKEQIIVQIKSLVEAFNRSKQYDKYLFDKKISEESEFTYEGRSLYLLRRIINSLIELTGQKVNDGITANLVLFSGLRNIALNSCLLEFNEDLLEVSSDFTNGDKDVEEVVRFNAFDSDRLSIVRFTKNRTYREYCFITQDNIFHGKSVSPSKEIKFHTLFNENGILTEKEYSQDLSEDFGVIKAKSETKYDIENNEFIETNIVTMDGEVIGKKAKSNCFSDLNNLVCINIPNFSVYDLSYSFDMVFPELSNVATEYLKNKKSSVK